MGVNDVNDFTDELELMQQQAQVQSREPSRASDDLSESDRRLPDFGYDAPPRPRVSFWQEGDPEPELARQSEQVPDVVPEESAAAEALVAPAQGVRAPTRTRPEPQIKSSGPGSLEFDALPERRVKEADDRKPWTGQWQDRRPGWDFDDLQDDIDEGLPEMPKKGLMSRIGSGIGNFFSAIGRGIAAPFKGIGKFFTKGKRKKAAAAEAAAAEQARVQAEAAAAAKQKQDGINALASQPLEFDAPGASASREDIEAPQYRREHLDPFYDQAQSKSEQYLTNRPRHIKDLTEQWRNPEGGFDASTAPTMPRKPEQFFQMPAGRTFETLQQQQKLSYLSSSEEVYNQSVEQWKGEHAKWSADRDQAANEVRERNAREGIAEERPGLADLYASQEKAHGEVGYGSSAVDLGWSKENSEGLGRGQALDKEALRRAERQLKPGLTPGQNDDDADLEDKRYRVEHQRRLLRDAKTPGANAALTGMTDSIDSALDTNAARREAARQQAEAERLAAFKQESARMQAEEDARKAADEAESTAQRHAGFMEQIRNPESREKYQPRDRSAENQESLARYHAQARDEMTAWKPGSGGHLYDTLTGQGDQLAGLSVRERMLARKAARGEAPLYELSPEEKELRSERTRARKRGQRDFTAHLGEFEEGLREGAFDDHEVRKADDSPINPMMDFIKSDDAAIEADKKAEHNRKLNRITQADSLGARISTKSGLIAPKFENWEARHTQRLNDYQRGHRADVEDARLDFRAGVINEEELEEEQDVARFEQAQLGRIDVGEGVSEPTEQDYEAPWVDMRSKVDSERERVAQKAGPRRKLHERRLAGLKAGNAGKADIRSARGELGDEYSHMPNDQIRSAINLYNTERLPAMKKGVLHHGGAKSKSKLPTTLPGRLQGDAVDRLPIFLQEQGLLGEGEQVSDTTRSALTQKRGDFLRGQLQGSLADFRPDPVEAPNPHADEDAAFEALKANAGKRWAAADKQRAAQEKADAKRAAKDQAKAAKLAEKDAKEREKWANDPKRIQAMEEAEKERKKGPSRPEEGREFGQVLGEMPVLLDGYMGASNLPLGVDVGKKMDESAAALSEMKPLVRAEEVPAEYEYGEEKVANGWTVKTAKERKAAGLNIISEKPKLAVSEEESQRYQAQYDQIHAPAKAAAAKYAKEKKLKDVPSPGDFLRSDNNPMKSSVYNDYASARKAFDSGYGDHIERTALSQLAQGDPHRALAGEVVPGKKTDKIKHTYKWKPGTEDMQKALSSGFDDFAQYRKEADLKNVRPDLKTTLVRDNPKPDPAVIPPVGAPSQVQSPVSAPVPAPSQMQPPMAPGNDGVIRMNVASSNRADGTAQLVAQQPRALPQPTAESMRLAEASKQYHTEQQAYNDSTKRKILNAVTFNQTNKPTSGVNAQMIQQPIEDIAREIDESNERKRQMDKKSKKKWGFFGK